MTERAWGIAVVALGAWEAAAYTTRRLPTVSELYWRGRRRHPRLAALAFVAWSAGLARHLARYEL